MLIGNALLEVLFSKIKQEISRGFLSGYVLHPFNRRLGQKWVLVTNTGRMEGEFL